jgi:hypothetical protein
VIGDRGYVEEANPRQKGPARRRRMKKGKSRGGGPSSVFRRQQRYLLSGDGKTVPMTFRLRNKGIGRTYVVEQMFNANNISSGVAATFGAFTFQLSDLTVLAPNTLFDKYRLRDVEVLFMPIGNQMVTDETGNNLIGNFYTAIDFDNAAAPTSFSQIERYSTAVQTLANQPQYRHFQPRAVIPVYSGSTFSDYTEAPFDVWCDVAYPATPYYALLWGMTATVNAGNCTYAVRVRYQFEFAATR